MVGIVYTITMKCERFRGSVTRGLGNPGVFLGGGSGVGGIYVPNWALTDGEVGRAEDGMDDGKEK